MSEADSLASDKDALIAELKAALAARDTLIETLRFQLAQLRRLSFGQSSERLEDQIEQLDLRWKSSKVRLRWPMPARQPR